MEGFPTSYHRKLYVAKNDSFVLNFYCIKFRYIFNEFYTVCPASYQIWWNNAK